MTISHSRPLALALSFLVASCGGEGLILPPDGAPAHIEVMSGNGQSARVGSTLADSLVLRVTDTQDRPVGGASVVIDFTADGAAASPATVTTDGDGRAASRLAVGTRVGPVTGKASVPVDPGVTPVEATISAIALPDNANGIALLSGDEQTGQVGTALAAPLVVVVTDAFGNPISGVQVGWTVTGGGSVTPDVTVTDANGQAAVTRTLGTTAGAQTAVATAGGLAGSPVTFNHTATAGTASGVVKISGDNQSGSPGTELALPLVVQVLDGSGNPIPNRPLTWTIGEGGGTVSAVNTTTDAQGNATTRWTLGPGVGRNTVNAVVSGLAPATFTATATAGTPSASTSTVSATPTTISAGTGSSTITITVRDGSNNPVSGASVDPASSGSGNTFTPATASTASNGVATFTFSSTVAETKTITATAGGVVLTDDATVNVQKVSSTIRLTAHTPDPSTTGGQVRVEFTVTGSGGTPTGDVTASAPGTTGPCTATVADGFCNLTFNTSGRHRITVTYGGDAQFSGDTDSENHDVNAAGPVGTTTVITSDDRDPSQAGQAITVAFTVTSSGGTPSGNVQVREPSGEGCDATVSAGSCSYTPSGAGTRTITATYQGSSAFNGSSDTEDHTVSAPVTQAPVGVSETYATPSPAGSELSVGVNEGVLANDTDADTARELLVVNFPLVQTTPGGTLELDVNGGFQYTPNSGTTADTFQYQARDPEGNLSNVVTVTITVTP